MYFVHMCSIFYVLTAVCFASKNNLKPPVASAAFRSVVVDSLFMVAPLFVFFFFCISSLFCCAVFCVLSSFAIVLLGKRE